MWHDEDEEFFDDEECEYEEEEDTHIKFNPFDLEHLVFAYYTGYVVFEFGDYSFLGEVLECLNENFIKVIIERYLEYEYVDKEGIKDFLEDDFLDTAINEAFNITPKDDDDIPTIFNELGVSIENGKLCIKDYKKIENPGDIVDELDNLGFDLQFKNTNTKFDEEGVYYVQYELDKNEKYPLTEYFLKLYNKKHKVKK